MDLPSASKHFPGFSHLYALADPGDSGAFVASIDTPGDRVLPMLRGDSHHIVSMEGRWAMGSARPSDVVWTTLAVPVLLSQHAVDLLRREHIAGWDAIPCTLYDKAREARPYSYLTVRGRCGPIDNTRSFKVEKIYPGGVFPAWKGLYFDPSTWDGSDIFMPQGDVGWIFITERVKRALKTANISNTLYTPLDQVERAQL